MGHRGGGSDVSENCVPHCTQIKFSVAIFLARSLISQSIDWSSPQWWMRSWIIALAHELHPLGINQRKVSSNRKRVGHEAGLLAFVAGECADSRAGAGVASS